VKRRALLLLALAGTGARAAGLQAEVLKRLEAAPVLQGEFEQSKSLKGFKNPLVSRGEFLLARSQGIVWDTKQPFASTLVLTRDRLLNELMFALLAGDLAALAGRFQVEGELQGAQGWKLQLTPTDALLAGQFSTIVLEGDRHVKLVRLAERNGDLTQIRFSALRSASALAPEQARRFEGAHGA
jgi:hypothetical protein